MSKQLRRKCAYCRQIFPVWRDEDASQYTWSRYGPVKSQYVAWTSDPFAAEIRGDYRKMWLCDGCQYESAMEI